VTLLLLDSNVLIDVLRGERQALEWLEGQAEGLAISVISWIEVLVGCEGV
jgi:predicted nucleic acid-binding protein